MQFDSNQVSRLFPWVNELWLFPLRRPQKTQPPSLDLLVVSTLPPREVSPGQRKRLLTQLQGQGEQRLDLRLTTSEQLARWLARRGRFADTFRREAVKLFEHTPGAS